MIRLSSRALLTRVATAGGRLLAIVMAALLGATPGADAQATGAKPGYPPADTLPAVQQRRAELAPAPDDSLPIVLTIEGGGSLGVYEAGMTWMLVEMFKRDGMKPRAERRFRKLYLASAAGASAGSINALLAAASWCDSLQQPPEQSLFWKTWIRAGTNTLLPSTYPQRGDWGYGEQGILSRAYFQRVAFPTLEREWEPASPRWRSGCRVPVGATVTRLEADTVELTSSVRAHNLHAASTFDVAVDSGSHGRLLSFEARRDDRRRPEAGRILGLPTRADGTIALDTLFQLFAASSGYPVAFGPQPVAFVAGTGDYPCGAPQNPCSTAPALFVDGGVFDNGPLALAIDLYFGGGFWTSRVQRRTPLPRFPYVLYVTPDARRHWHDRRTEILPRAEAGGAERVGGLAGGLKLLSSAVPAAREYEIQSLVRLLQAEAYPDTAPCRQTQECFVAPDRWHPLMGDRLYGFGGFLARPFREYDFYVGMYDALVLAARSADPEGTDVACRRVAPRDANECVRRRLWSFIERPVVDLGAVAPCMLRRLYAAEFIPDALGPGSRRDVLFDREGCLPQLHADRTPADSSLRVVAAVADAMGRLMHDTLTSEGLAEALAQERCGVEGPLHGMLCDQGLLSVANDLQNDAATRAILERWNHAPECRAGPSPERNADCRADDWFIRWIAHTRRETHGLLRNALKRLDETTPHGDGGNLAAVATVHALSLAFLSANETYRFGPDLGQTSLPERGSLLSTAGWELIPSSLEFPLTSAGSIAGWEGRYVFREHFSLVLPGQVAYSAMRTPEQLEGSRWYVIPGFGIGVLPYAGMHFPRFISSIRPEVQWWLGGGSDVPSWNRRRYAYGGTLFLSSNKFRLSVFHQPDLFTNQPRGHVMYALGIHDVNGLLYWVKHLNGH